MVLQKSGRNNVIFYLWASFPSLDIARQLNAKKSKVKMILPQGKSRELAHSLGLRNKLHVKISKVEKQIHASY